MKKLKLSLFLLTLTLVLFMTACSKPVTPTKTKLKTSKNKTEPSKAPAKEKKLLEATVTQTLNKRPLAIIETEKGRIVVELFPEVAPKTVANFIKLAEQGFYNGLTWHRVVPGFVIQGGDPLGNGTGGPGYTIPAEFNSKKHLKGTVAMARAADPNSAGSQFYITLAPQPQLDGQYTVFGQTVEGLNVIDKIVVGDHMQKITITYR